MQVFVWDDLDLKGRQKILARPLTEDKTATVAAIIARVQKDGDKALQQMAQEFDKVKLDDLRVQDNEWAAGDSLDENSKKAILKAYENIYDFHSLQKPEIITSTKEGIELRKEYRPISKVGLYVAGGSAPLVSTLLMTAIPAKIAGCEKIIATTPPQKNGLMHPAVLFAAKLCGVSELYKIGGAGAIAAFAYGTETIPKVDKIFGPGNSYVTTAKLLVSADRFGAAIDMPAGPSEVLVIADEAADPEFIASDLLAQAEHGPDSQVMLVTTDKTLPAKVNEAVERQLLDLPRDAIAKEALLNSRMIIAKSLEECFQISNDYAPEHLIVQTKNPEKYTGLIQNAGSVFLGEWTPESLGDYASGTNHVLPTFGFARNYSGLGVISFMKSMTFQRVLSEDALLKIAPTVEKLADIEGLHAHAKSVEIRCKKIKKGR